MRKSFFKLAVVLLALVLTAAVIWSAPKLNRRYYHHGLEFEVVARGLDTPWSLAFLPDGSMLVAERPGRMRRVGLDGRVGPPIAGVPPVYANVEGGLLGLALAPDFERSHRVFWAYAEPDPQASDHAGTAVASGRLEGDALRDVQVIFRQAEKFTDGMHFGSRLLFDVDGQLLIGLGDRSQRPKAQQLDSALGKILRIGPDGVASAGNPYLDRPGAQAQVWSYGHRNVQGLAFRPGTRELWATEHGPNGGDEVNLIRPGANYGWPVITYGCEYTTCARIGEGTAKAGMEQPVAWFGPASLPISQLAFVTSDRYPGWQGHAVAGVLNGPGLIKMTIEGQRITRRQPLWLGPWSRVRDVVQGPDGFLYLAVERPEGAILRLKPRTLAGWPWPDIPGGPDR